MTSNLKVGDSVHLNDEGLQVIFGHAWKQALAVKSINMRITHVEPDSITYPEVTHIVQVDNVEINQNLLWDACFIKNLESG